MYQTVFNKAFLTSYDTTAPAGSKRTIGTLDGNCIKIQNFSNYGVSLCIGEEVIDYIPAYQYLITDNNTAYSLWLDTSPTTGYLYQNRNISVRSYTDKNQPYGVGMLLTMISNETVNVAGSMTVSNTPNVAIAGTPAVNVANTVATTISGTVNAAITSGTVNANIQNASLNSNITNALLQTGCTAYANTSFTTTLTAGQTFTIGVPLPPSMYDAFCVQVSCNNNGVTFSSKYSLNYYFFGVDAAYSDPGINNGNMEWVASQNFGAVSNLRTVLKNGKPTLGNGIYFILSNNSGGTITGDNITVKVYARYASNNVTNQSYQPVPTSGNYYGTGADGVLNVTTNSNVANTANVPFIGNYSSITINSGVYLSFTNQAKYAIFYCTGDVTINGTLYAPSGVTNIGAPGQQLSLNGIALPNAGNGGNGGKGGDASNTGGAGGTGGVGNCFTGGAGGGGGGGADLSNLGNPGGSGGTGYGNASGGAPGGGSAQWGGTGNNPNTGTICIVAAGTITINGGIWAAGGAGGAGGAAVNTYAGGGGACGSNAGGAGAAPGAGGASGGGGGAGGGGGGVVFLFAGGSVNVGGTINVNGGAGGAGGASYAASNGANGATGQAGSIRIYQYGGTVGGGQ